MLENSVELHLEESTGFDNKCFEYGNYFQHKEDAEDCLEVLQKTLTDFRKSINLT